MHKDRLKQGKRKSNEDPRTENPTLFCSPCTINLLFRSVLQGLVTPIKIMRTRNLSYIVNLDFRKSPHSDTLCIRAQLTSENLKRQLKTHGATVSAHIHIIKKQGTNTQLLIIKLQALDTYLQDNAVDDVRILHGQPEGEAPGRRYPIAPYLLRFQPSDGVRVVGDQHRECHGNTCTGNKAVK
jgi:hypothetical protein